MSGKLAPPLNTKQVERAVDALLNYVQRSKKSGGKEQLLDDSDPISVLIGMKTIPATNGRSKPYLITLEHPLMNPEETEVCLLVKDPQREFKDKIEAKGIKCIKKVIGVTKLKNKFKQYEAKRQLCASYDLFLADDRILPMLPHLIGKEFFKKKKQPLPVKLTRENWDAQFKTIFNATPFYLAEGLCSTVKAGHTSMDRTHIIDNIVSALDKVAEILPKKWQGIQTIHIKTHDSIALPIYHSLPTGTAIDFPAARATEEKTAGKRKAGDVEGEEDEHAGAKHRRFEKRAEARRALKPATDKKSAPKKAAKAAATATATATATAKAVATPKAAAATPKAKSTPAAEKIAGKRKAADAEGEVKTPVVTTPSVTKTPVVNKEPTAKKSAATPAGVQMSAVKSKGKSPIS